MNGNGMMAELFPEDPAQAGKYWLEKKNGERIIAYWLPGYLKWHSPANWLRSPREISDMGFIRAVYDPTPDEAALLSADAARRALGFGAVLSALSGALPAPSTQTLDDRQAPEWTLKEPGVLVHRDGRHFIHWEHGWRSVPAVFSPRGGADPIHIGEYSTLEQAKAAAEQHARWCKEFGL